MRCEFVSTHLQDYLEDRLPPHRRDAITAHIATCPECAAELAGWRQFWEDLSGLAPCASTPDLEERIMSGLDDSALLPRGLVAVFILACLGTLAGFSSWFDGLQAQKDIISACLWAVAGTTAVLTVWRLVERKLAGNDRGEAVQEDDACAH